jgi:ATP-dependent Clp protease ATP-binding subunit ClpA
VDFRNTIIVMTSNLGSQWILELSGADSREDPARARAEMERRVEAAVHAHFRPELLNRIDEIVIFQSLTREQLRRIVDLAAEGLRAMLAERRLSLRLTEAAKDALVEEGYDPQFGARPLKRTLQRRIQNSLAMRLLRGEFQPGSEIEVDFARGEFEFRTARPEPAAVRG